MASEGSEQNLRGGELKICGEAPMTGFHRDGCCRTGPDDHGCHAVCAWMTSEFLEFSKNLGNDLSTPVPEYGFPGLKAGDRWCLCASRWKQALDAGVAPPIDPEATSAAATKFVPRSVLEEYGID